MAYADYKFYVEDYRGDLTKEEFDKAIVKASAYVRQITFGRAGDYAGGDEVKLATCAACDIIAADVATRSKHNGKNVVSENNDGYSVSFASEQASGESVEELLSRKIHKAAEVYLEPTGLLCWGCEP